MAGSVSPATGQCYGVARSSFHVARRAAQTPASRRPTDRRGPKPKVPDGDLPAAIRADLARSPWSGPGRARAEAEKAGVRWTAAPPNARSGRGCGCRAGARVARKRVLRLMREHALLSPHRARPRPDEAHDRKIVPDAPNIVRATDGTQIGTVRDGKVRRFATVEDWNAEAPGWHVAKRGTRRAALKATGLAVRARRRRRGLHRARDQLVPVGHV
jgi:hypothetical protein